MSDFSNQLSIELYDLGSQELYKSDELPGTLLKTGIEQSLQKATDFAGKVYETIVKEAPAGTQIKLAFDKGSRYVLDLDDETKDAIEKGLIKLTTENGKMKAQIRLPNGRYGKRIDVTKEVYAKGIDPIQMANAMQMKALQDQVEQIQRQITIIGANVGHVIEGLQNDRIGLYYSGARLYLEARNITDPEIRRLLMTQSLRALSDASYQLIFEIKTDIKYLQNGEYKKDKSNSKNQILSHMKNIDQSFIFIHRAMLMRAAIYCCENELAAMASVLNEYSGFIEGIISRNANMLSQCDIRDTGTLQNGIWRSRAGLRLNAADFAKRLSVPEETIYIELTGENENEEK